MIIRTLLLAVLALVWAQPASAQMSLVNQDTDIVASMFGTDSNHVVAGFSATAGNLIVVMVNMSQSASRTVSTIDDDGTTTYSAICDNDGVASFNVAIWAGIAAGGGAGTNVSVTLDNTDTSSGMVVVLEFSGASSNLSSVPCARGDISVAATDHPAGDVTPDTTNNVIVGIVQGSSGTYNQDASPAFTTPTGASDGNRIAGYLTQTAATTVNYTPTTSATETSVVAAAAFRGAGPGGSQEENRMLLLGVGGGR
jgi:hypothetical protein